MTPLGMRGPPISPARAQPTAMATRTVVATPVQQAPAQVCRIVGRAQTARGSYAAPSGSPATASMGAHVGASDATVGYPVWSAGVSPINASASMYASVDASPVGATASLPLRPARSSAGGRMGGMALVGSPTGASVAQPALSSGRVPVGAALASPRADSPTKPPSSTSAALAAVVAANAATRPRYASVARCPVDERPQSPATQTGCGAGGACSSSMAQLPSPTGCGGDAMSSAALRQGLAARAAACVHPGAVGSGRIGPGIGRRGSSLVVHAMGTPISASGGGAASSGYGLRGLKVGFDGCERSLSAGVRLTSGGELPSSVNAGGGGACARSSSALPTVSSTEAFGHGAERMWSQPLPQHMGGGVGPMAVISTVEKGADTSGGEPEAEPGHLVPATIVTSEDFLEASRWKIPQSAKVHVADIGTLRLDVRLSPAEFIRWRDLKIIEPISTGSFGEVFLAIYKGQEVSVKRCILRAEGSMTKEQLHNLEREINTYRTLDHPQIVKYIGCVLEPPNLAIVTEFVPNGNVFDLLYTYRVNLPAVTRLKIASQVSLAICYMHSCDPIVIHRDLKTQNLVLDADYSVKLCDFGKTQPMDDDSALPMLQDNGGSPRYMAPECFKTGGFVTEKVDIWSLGCCLVEVFGGPLPYEDVPAMNEVLKVLLEQRKPPMVPSWFTPQVRPMLSGCYAFDPKERLEISEVQLVLKGLTPEELERHGMDRRRTK